MRVSQRKRLAERARVAALIALLCLVTGELLLINPARQKQNAEGISASIGRAASQLAIAVKPAPEAYATVVTRDLFATDRQAPPAALARFSAASATASSSELRVVGIVTAGAERIALVLTGEGGEALHVRVGDRVGRFQVRDIMPNEIVMSASGLERRVAVEHQVADGSSTGAAAMSDGMPLAPSQPRANGISGMERAKAIYDEYLENQKRRPLDRFEQPTASGASPGH